METTDPITYMQTAISSIQGDFASHREGEISQELSDRIYGLQLAYQDFQALELPASKEQKTIDSKVAEFSTLTHIEKESAEGVDRVSQPVIAEATIPEELQPIPNKGDNCFLIAAYQFVKHNLSQIFSSESFKKDDHLEALRAFDQQYDHGPVTADDMQKVRTDAVAEFGIKAEGHQDADEALQSVFLDHVDSKDPLFFQVETTNTYEVTVAAEQKEAVSAFLKEDYKNVASEENEGLVTFRFQAVSREAQLSVKLGIEGVPDGATLEEVIARDFTALGDDLEIAPKLFAKKVEVNKTVPKAPAQVIMSLKRFDNFGNKILTKVEVPKGQVRLDEETYKVKGFIVHLGMTQEVGHYVEYQNIKGKWYLLDDGLVSPISEESAIRAMSDAYILYGERS